MNKTALSLAGQAAQARTHVHAPANMTVRELVRQASAVIAPLWPIAAFIARHPWMEMEHLSFAEVADRLQDMQGVRLYPSRSVLSAALARGEIDANILARCLEQWLDLQTLPVPRQAMARLCHALLKSQEESPAVADDLLDLAQQVCAKLPAATVRHGRPAVRPLSVQLGEPGRRLDQQMIKWCKLFLDEGQALWPLPGRDEGLYRAWRRLVPLDPSLTRTERARLATWPEDPETALVHALAVLGVAEDDQAAYLTAHVLALPGWAGMLAWTSRRAGQGDEWLLEYLAVRLSLEWAFCAPWLPKPEVDGAATGHAAAGDRAVRGAVVRDATAGEAAAGAAGQTDTNRDPVRLVALWLGYSGLTPSAFRQLPADVQAACIAWLDRFLRVDRWQLWLEAWERTYETRLRASILSSSRQNDPAAQGKEPSPVAQLLFCIDVRSEPLRRQLEQAGPFATYGCAGFFNLPVQTRELDSLYAHPSCPAIVEPKYEIRECPAPASSVTSYRRRRNVVQFVGGVFKKLKQDLLASLVLPESSGPWLGLYTLARTIAPGWAGRLWQRAEEAAYHKPPTQLTLVRGAAAGNGWEDGGLPVGLTTEEMVAAAGGLLRTIGLVSFAPLVVVCGHESRTTNNPHQAALDCGACGGAAGWFNARAFAAMCNLRAVREGLARQGIVIPDDTIFVAAEHITTTDELCFLDVPPLSGPAQAALQRLKQALAHVGPQLSAQRLARLPHVGPVRRPHAEASRRAVDWSEVRPEWGLAGCAAFVVGRRRLTQHADLAGRVFLHSYDWRLDPEGEQLAAIVAGPVTVAQWINLQYYASTVAPHVYGSGNKATQTVTGGIGVMQGNGSDLMAGLPWQSVAASDHALYHAPLRLLVVIEAPSNHIARVLAGDASFRRKVENGWLRLASFDPVRGTWETWEADSLPARLSQAG
ncbi:UPF0753 protein YbcC [Alicyclobacillus cellulosilyticus]|uniref:Probable inorganic carbon transporter subunit DabA n=1 Tax=Alicyclobacillus cellulosilyticus TaxID=1003997 RepID=A0A917K6B6_9BACL|nr:DUF2309 domain-containing protein [Alicyclobacillus cellulosilyticus]GGJ00670.1 UPF0753 protein YbcC [Alicyclobacillus cellulosilyticus]